MQTSFPSTAHFGIRYKIYLTLVDIPTIWTSSLHTLLRVNYLSPLELLKERSELSSRAAESIALYNVLSACKFFGEDLYIMDTDSADSSTD